VDEGAIWEALIDALEKADRATDRPSVTAPDRGTARGSAEALGL